MSRPRHSGAMVAIMLATTLALTGCGQGGTAASDLPVSDTVSAEGVVLAAVLLSTADIEASVAEGLVTPDEVDEARRAIEDGTLDEWRELAEQTPAE
ncbi:MAG TPA: hypothetical protein VFT01_08260 [Homoserinimonas sp.]|nr:hypothetical protein [Homoserinimonas sp.]